MNGQQYSSSGVEYTYRELAVVSSASPSRGAAEGGTPVTLLGSGFSSAAEALGELWCRFNSTLLRAAYVADAGHAVTLCVPWVDPAEQANIFPGQRTFATPAEQEAHARRQG